jgi:hypothetical protein
MVFVHVLCLVVLFAVGDVIPTTTTTPPAQSNTPTTSLKQQE